MVRTAPGLLAPDETAAVRVLRSAGRSAFLLTADHAGNAIPRSLGTLGLPEHERGRHIAWDIGIAGVTERLSALLDATAVLQPYSRLVIDCNRSPDTDGSIPGLSERTGIPGNLELPPGHRLARRQEIFTPYHDGIRTLLDARRDAGRPTLLVAMHSFTPVYLGVERSMQVGVLYRHDARLARILLECLAATAGLAVGDNQPYHVSDETDYTIPVHGERRGLAHVGIEIRQDLIRSEAGQVAWADRLADLLRLAETRLAVEGRLPGLEHRPG